MCAENSNGCPEYARARNARLLMSNIIPEFSPDSTELVTYCIWFSEVPNEETCRQVARKYPFLRYHVGRVCAVAGYTDVFQELDLLPDTTIAHEALDSGEKSLDIHKLIVSQPVRYSVMDDHTLSIRLDNPRAGSYMDGDACVASTLGVTPFLEDFESEYPRTTRDRYMRRYGYRRRDCRRLPTNAYRRSTLRCSTTRSLTTNKDLLILFISRQYRSVCPLATT